jgi:hypothetical protein
MLFSFSVWSRSIVVSLFRIGNLTMDAEHRLLQRLQGYW